MGGSAEDDPVRVGRYEIVRELGRGGMARVHLARQLDLDRYAALKELGSLHREDAEMAARFVRESRLAGALNHPSIVTVLDFFEHDGTPYIAMEYIPRGSLRPWVGRLTWRRSAACWRACWPGSPTRTRARRGPPGPEAREPDGHRRRAREDHRLRHRQGPDRQRDGRVPHRDRRRASGRRPTCRPSRRWARASALGPTSTPPA